MEQNIKGKVTVNAAVYSATQHAVRALSDGLRQEVKAWNIRTTNVWPGAVATELRGSATEPDIAKGLHDLHATNAISADAFAGAVA